MNNRGFTLVELLTVIVILGIVTGISLVSVNVSLTDSKKEAEKVFKANITKAIESYISANASNYSNCSSDCTFNFKELIDNNYLHENDVKNPNKEDTNCYSDDTKVTVKSIYDDDTKEFKKYCFNVTLECMDAGDKINTCDQD